MFTDDNIKDVSMFLREEVIVRVHVRFPDRHVVIYRATLDKQMMLHQIQHIKTLSEAERSDLHERYVNHMRVSSELFATDSYIAKLDRDVYVQYLVDVLSLQDPTDLRIIQDIYLTPGKIEILPTSDEDDVIDYSRSFSNKRMSISEFTEYVSFYRSKNIKIDIEMCCPIGQDYSPVAMSEYIDLVNRTNSRIKTIASKILRVHGFPERGMMTVSLFDVTEKQTARGSTVDNTDHPASWSASVGVLWRPRVLGEMSADTEFAFKKYIETICFVALDFFTIASLKTGVRGEIPIVEDDIFYPMLSETHDGTRFSLFVICDIAGSMKGFVLSDCHFGPKGKLIFGNVIAIPKSKLNSICGLFSYTNITISSD